MKKAIIYLIAGTTLLVASCKKDKDENPPATTPRTVSQYAQLKVGNYWIYERFSVDASGNETSLGQFDSCYVEKDTIINNLTYTKYVSPYIGGPLTLNLYQRDSSGYLVDQNGIIYLAPNDFTSTLEDRYVLAINDTVAHVTKQMVNKDSVVTVPAGTYTIINCRTMFEMYPGYNSGGTFRPINSRYASGVGIVWDREVFFASQPTYTDRKLVRFHLN
ncbi:MAG: hypothetical protein JNL49_12640 [Bacteroidia bacterium]|nr:hypothetical protein [Bacteroidia bacterium]